MLKTADRLLACPHSAFSIQHSALSIILVAVGLASLPGCAGYQIGRRSLYRPDVRTVHVPMIQSDSYRRYLGERLTEAIVKEIELRTPYKVVDADSADSVLSVRLVSDAKRVLANNRFSEPRDIETDFFVQASWIDRRGDLIMSQDNLPAAPLLVNLGQQANFVPEGGQSLITAQQEAIQKLAQQVVGQMEMAW
jgi:Lipopolysaccharide-assembly